MLWMQTREKLQLLGIYAHPHDCTHSIGTMGNHVKNGDAATVAVLTDGGATHNERLWEELHKDEDEQDPGVVEQQRQAYAEQKYEEARQACGYFGVTDVRFLGFRDKPVIRTDEMVESVVDLICDVRPDVLITEVPALQTHDRRFAAPDDHTTCAAVVTEALVIAQHPRQGTSRVPHKPARLFYAAPSLPGDEVDLFVDVSDWEEERIKAEMSYASQGHTPSYARQRVVRQCGHYGWSAGVNMAEKFISANNQVASLLPVNDHDLERSRGSGIDHAVNVMGDEYREEVDRTLRAKKG
jgi:LmbE family N-acetylglucosaminyl deacetylase